MNKGSDGKRGLDQVLWRGSERRQCEGKERMQAGREKGVRTVQLWTGASLAEGRDKDWCLVNHARILKKHMINAKPMGQSLSLKWLLLYIRRTTMHYSAIIVKLFQREKMERGKVAWEIDTEWETGRDWYISSSLSNRRYKPMFTCTAVHEDESVFDNSVFSMKRVIAYSWLLTRELMYPKYSHLS